ncbi:MAG: DNA-binding protein [Microcoleus sp.]
MTTAIKQVWVKFFIKEGCIGTLSLIFASALFSCGNSPMSQLNLGLNVASIGEVQQKRQVDAEVYLRGKVENRAPFVGNAAYQLQDDTGSIWILTKQVLPQLGDEVLLKGAVRYKTIKLKDLAGKDLGEVYVEEIEQLKRTPAADKGK